MVANPSAFRERTLARLRGEVVAPVITHDDTTALGRKRNRNTARNAQRRKAITPWQWKRCLKHFGGLCAYCREKPGIEREHFVPLLDGGTYAVGNVVPSCVGCNRRKKDTPPAEWLADRPELFAEITAYLKGAR